MKRIVIFDLDGTLLDSVADLANATNYALTKLGFTNHPQEKYRYFVGNGINKLFERALPDGEKTEENVLKVKALFVPYYNEHKQDCTQPYEGVEHLLKALTDKGIDVAVASNKYNVATTQLVKDYFPNVNFTAVLGQREGIPVKPHPQIVRDILQLTDYKLEDVLYVGDTPVDMQTAHNAGVEVAAVTWGFRTKRELEMEKPTYIVNHPMEIMDIIG